MSRGDFRRHLEIVARAQLRTVQRLELVETALAECATRLRACTLAGGSDAEYADLAVARYFDLLNPKDPP